MATDFNYMVNLDTRHIMSQVSEVRSQVGMALGSPTGFQSPAMGIQGGGFGSDFGGGAASGLAQMAQGFARGPAFMGGLGGMAMGSSFGGTFTNPAMAYTPHYGMMQAETDLSHERLVHKYGLAAAGTFRPPGVGAGEYAIGVESNYQSRMMEAQQQAGFQARNAMYSGAAGLGLGSIAGAIGWHAGGRMGAGLGVKMGIGATAGKFLGGIGLSMLGWNAAEDFAGGYVRDKMAEVEQVAGVTRELGTIAGAERGLTRTQRYGLGTAARDAAKEIGMDVQGMGEILALGRQHGMLPTATDPGKAKEQFANFARSIDEGAQMLHTSLANATQVIKGMSNMGYGAQGGILNLIGMGASAGISPMAMYGVGMQGAGIANANLLSRGQGFGTFTSGVMAAAGAGMSREELGMIGGVTGGGAMIGRTQMGAALSPMGDVQLMAAMSGESGGGMLSLPGQALSGLMGAGGGDLLSGAAYFQTHKRELMRGTGARGLQTIAREQFLGYEDFFRNLMPNASDETVGRMVAQNIYGKNEVEAKLYTRAMHGGAGGGGGGGGGGAYAAQLQALQEIQLSRAAGGMTREGTIESLQRRAGEVGDVTKWTQKGMLGFMGGAWTGLATTAIGAGIDFASYMFRDSSGPGLRDVLPTWAGGSGATPQDLADRWQQAGNQRFDEKMAAYKSQIGYAEIDPQAAAVFRNQDLSQVSLGARETGFFGGSGVANMSAGFLNAAGIEPVAPGPGTTRVGGSYYATSQIQSVVRSTSLNPRRATRQQEEQGGRLGYKLRSTLGGKEQRELAARLASFGGMSEVEQKENYGLSFDVTGANGIALREQFSNLLAKGTDDPRLQGAWKIAQAKWASADLDDPVLLAVMSGVTGGAPAPNWALAMGVTGSEATREAMLSLASDRDKFMAANLGIVDLSPVTEAETSNALKAGVEATHEAIRSGEGNPLEAGARVGAMRADSNLALEATMQWRSSKKGRATLHKAAMAADTEEARAWELSQRMLPAMLQVMPRSLREIDQEALIGVEGTLRTNKRAVGVVAQGTKEGGLGLFKPIDVTPRPILDEGLVASLARGLNITDDEARKQLTADLSSIKQHTTMANEEAELGKTGLPLPGGGKGRGKGGQLSERAAGFGEYEQAITTINKTLKEQEKATRSATRLMDALAKEVGLKQSNSTNVGPGNNKASGGSVG